MNVIYEPHSRSQAELETEWLRERFAAISLRPLLGRLRTLAVSAPKVPAARTPEHRAGIVTRAG